MTLAISEKPARLQTSAALNSRQRFLAACNCEPLSRPPVWLMRQAGRALPEYRALKEKHSFVEMVKSPELATEVTLQPIRRYGFDAAILFCDILVIPEALGQPYHFAEGGGVQMEFPIRTAADIARLDVARVQDHLCYATDALRLIRRELGQERALLGFAGSPWTLANFMLDGGSSKHHQKALQLLEEDPALFNALCEKLTIAVTQFLQMQIDAGVDAVQIFESLGFLLPKASFAPASSRWTKQIISALQGQVPVILFTRGTDLDWNVLNQTGADVLGIDWTISLAEARERIPAHIGIQGNLDPAILIDSEPETVVRETRNVLTQMRKRPGHIFNLGHGLPPKAKLENIGALVQTVQEGL